MTGSDRIRNLNRNYEKLLLQRSCMVLTMCYENEEMERKRIYNC